MRGTGKAKLVITSTEGENGTCLSLRDERRDCAWVEGRGLTVGATGARGKDSPGRRLDVCISFLPFLASPLPTLFSFWVARHLVGTPTPHPLSFLPRHMPPHPCVRIASTLLLTHGPDGAYRNSRTRLLISLAALPSTYCASLTAHLTSPPPLVPLAMVCVRSILSTCRGRETCMEGLVRNLFMAQSMNAETESLQKAPLYTSEYRLRLDMEAFQVLSLSLTPPPPIPSII